MSLPVGFKFYAYCGQCRRQTSHVVIEGGAAVCTEC